MQILPLRAGALTNNGTLDAASFTNTVTYTGASQNIAAPNGTVTGYSNLVVNGTGTAVAPASLIVREIIPPIRLLIIPPIPPHLL